MKSRLAAIIAPDIAGYPDVFQRDEAKQDCLTFLAGVFPRHFPVAKISSTPAAESHCGAGGQPR